MMKGTSTLPGSPHFPTLAASVSSVPEVVGWLLAIVHPNRSDLRAGIPSIELVFALTLGIRASSQRYFKDIGKPKI